MIRVIINADDFGLSTGVNRGIVRAFRDGVLSSTTMMANMPAFDDAVRLARENPDLPVGVHLSLVWGAPVAEPKRVPSLVDASGNFPTTLSTLARRNLSGRMADQDMRTEFTAQIQRVLEAGLTPTHVDTHKHIHCLPRVLDAVIAAANEAGIGKIRLPVEVKGSSAPSPYGSPASRAKVALLRLLFRGARTKLAKAGLRTTDHFAGIGCMDRLDSDALDGILAGLRPGVTEIMCHPAEADDEPIPYVRSSLNRTRELAALTDPRVKKRLAASGAELVHFGNI